MSNSQLLRRSRSTKESAILEMARSQEHSIPLSGSNLLAILGAYLVAVGGYKLSGNLEDESFQLGCDSDFYRRELGVDVINPGLKISGKDSLYYEDSFGFRLGSASFLRIDDDNNNVKLVLVPDPIDKDEVESLNPRLYPNTSGNDSDFEVSILAEVRFAKIIIAISNVIKHGDFNGYTDPLSLLHTLSSENGRCYGDNISTIDNLLLEQP